MAKKYTQADTSKKKAKKAFGPTIKLFFKSIINNEAAIEGGRRQPWWTSLVIAVVGVVLALIPTFVQIGNTEGDQIIAGNTYSTDVGLVTLAEALNDNGVSLKVVSVTSGETTSNQLLTIADEAEFKAVFTQTRYIQTQSYDYFVYKTHDDVEKLHVYYFAEGATHEFNVLRDYLRGLKYSTSEPITGQVRPVSYVILTNHQMLGALYQPKPEMDGSLTQGQVSGNYSRLPVGYDLKDFALKNAEGESILALKADPLTYDQYIAGVKSNFAHFYREAYKPVKEVTFWSFSGTYAAAYVVIVLFMGLVLFLVTRGKYSPNRDWTFLQSMGVGAWMSLTPALITMIVGFFAPAYAAMGFIMINSFRIMWFSMKAMRESAPPENAQAKK